MHINSLKVPNQNPNFGSTIKMPTSLHEELYKFAESFEKERVSEGGAKKLRSIVSGLDSLLNDGKNDNFEIKRKGTITLEPEKSSLKTVFRPFTAAYKNGFLVAGEQGIFNFPNFILKVLPKFDTKNLAEYEATALGKPVNTPLTDMELKSKDLIGINLNHFRDLLAKIK